MRDGKGRDTQLMRHAAVPAPQVRAREGIECGEGLVEQNDVVSHKIRAQECRPLPHATRELVWPAALRARKPKALEEGFGLGPRVGDAHATEHQGQTDVVDDALAGKEQVLLQHVADAARDARHVLAMQEDVALEGARQT